MTDQANTLNDADLDAVSAAGQATDKKHTDWIPVLSVSKPKPKPMPQTREHILLARG